jgi:hypothetical protein
MRIHCCSLLVILLPALVSAATIHVPGDQPTVQAGIDAALAGDEVLVACGTYLEHDIQMKSGITLRGETGEAGCVILDAQQLGRVMIGQELDENTFISGITFTGGIVDVELLYGAGVHFTDSALHINHCRFTGNYSYYMGGGAFFMSSPAELSFCLFDGNTAEHGGGGGLRANFSEMVIRDCRFENNDGIDGAGLICGHGSPLIERCVFLNNDGDFWGGAMMIDYESSPLIRNCTLVGNDAHQGGGLWASSSSHPVMENCIVAFNTEGSGVFVMPSSSNPSSITLACCDLFHNADGNYGGDMDDQTGLDGNFATHPLFCDRDNGDLSLSSSSPCLPPGNDCGQLIGALGEGCAFPTSIDTPAARPFTLMQNRPNPFNPSTEIHFDLEEPAQVSLGIYDLGGRLLRSLLHEEFRPAGLSTLRWDGRDGQDRPLPTGLYLYRLDGPGWSSSRKMTLLK